MEKYKFKISDFIPTFGLMNYAQRNEFTCVEEKNMETKVIGRALILTGYNLTLIISATYGVIKGIEKVVN